MKIMQIFIILFTFLLIGCGDSPAESKGKPIDTAVVNEDTVNAEQEIKKKVLPSIESKYRVDKDGNILNKNGEILDSNARLDENNNIVDRDGQVINSAGNIVGYDGSIIGVYIPPERSILIASLKKGSNFDLDKHGNKDIYIDGVRYTIQATLTTSTDRKIGISNNVQESFLDLSKKKGFVFSPLGYVAVVRDDIKPSDFFSKYDGLHYIDVVFRLNSSFSFVNGYVVYESLPDTKECLSNTLNTLIFNMYLNVNTIGYFSLECDINTGMLKTIKDKTVFHNTDRLNYFFIKVDGDIGNHRVDISSGCYSPKLDAGVPPIPDLCLLKDLY